MVYASGPELELYAVCGNCFSGDHAAHVAIDGDKRCTCVTCCASEREREVAARAVVAPASVVASAPVTTPDDIAQSGKATTLEPFMHVMVGMPIAFGVERVGATDENGQTVPVVALRFEHSTGSQIFSIPPQAAAELAHKILREATGLHIAGG